MLNEDERAAHERVVGVERPETDRLDALVEALAAVDEPSPDGAATGGEL